MRTKDDIKREALFEATVRLVNDIGFVSSSVSKIAKEAKVSPATIYVYHKNKEDLLVSAYLRIKRNLSEAVLENFDPGLPIRDILRNVWFGMFDHISGHPDYFQFAEQFSNSPYISIVNPEEIEKYFEPVAAVIMKGIEQKIIKDVDHHILKAFMFYPIMVLSNTRLCGDFELTRENMETAFTMAWDAIKL